MIVAIKHVSTLFVSPIQWWEMIYQRYFLTGEHTVQHGENGVYCTRPPRVLCVLYFCPRTLCSFPLPSCSPRALLVCFISCCCQTLPLRLHKWETNSHRLTLARNSNEMLRYQLLSKLHAWSTVNYSASCTRSFSQLLHGSNSIFIPCYLIVWLIISPPLLWQITTGLKRVWFHDLESYIKIQMKLFLY